MSTPPLHTPEETAALRRAVLGRYERYAARHFAGEPLLQSIGLFVAQYWNDNADDEVSFETVPSQLATPTLTRWDDLDGTGDPVNLPDPDLRDRCAKRCNDALGIYGCLAYISAFAAFCREGATQDDDPADAYVPYAYFRRVEGGVATEVVGVMVRPWLDGVTAEDVASGFSEGFTYEDYRALTERILAGESVGPPWVLADPYSLDPEPT